MLNMNVPASSSSCKCKCELQQTPWSWWKNAWSWFTAESKDEKIEHDEEDAVNESESEMGSADVEDKRILLDPSINDTGSFPATYLVVRLALNVQPEAVKWLIQKMTGKKQDGGAELLVRCEPYSDLTVESLILHVTASKLKFLECAEYLELKKLDERGELREFSVMDLDSFLHGSTNLDNLLSPAEKQLIVVQELENIRARPTDTIIPGYASVTLFTGQSIFEAFLQEGLIVDHFPLHNEEELDKFSRNWYFALLQSQPLEDIRRYFGDGITLYFSFLGFYTMSLTVPSFFGVIQAFIPEHYAYTCLSFFCILNVFWCTVTLELWKRECSQLAYQWGTLRMIKWEDPRPNHKGIMKLDPVTGRYQPSYPWWKTCAKVYGVSFPIVALCIVVASWIMLYSIWIEEYLTESKQRHGSQVAGWFTMLPSIIYAGLVFLMNSGYRKLATFLTEWENHRTQSSFERHRVTKLVIFEFVNNFMSLFYLAFYIQDIELLRSQVNVMLILMQFLNQFQESIMPLFIRKIWQWGKANVIKYFPRMNRYLGEPIVSEKNELKSSNASQSQNPSLAILPGLQSLEDGDPRIEESRKQKDMDQYEGTFDDYLEMFIQFGYVFLFSAVSPLAALWALFNNLIEIKSDAFKLCKVFQRPFAKRTNSIGAWQMAFEVLGVIAVMTNCALLSMSPNLRSYAPNLTGAEWILLFVAIEHIVIAMKLILRQLIPDIPAWVKTQLARIEFRSRQALKKEQATKSRRQLTRRFKTIHGPRNKNLLSLTPDTSSTVVRRGSKTTIENN